MKLRLSLIAFFILSACTASGSSVESDSTSTTSGNIERGADLYANLCASCHGDDLSGGMGGSLLGEAWDYGGEDEDILRAIMDGIEDVGMPAFDETLSTLDGEDLLAFIKSGGDMVTVPAITTVPSVQDKVQIDTWVSGLSEPWGFVFTGAADAIVTEKSGQLRLIKDGNLLESAVTGVPEVTDNGQGGLLDVALDPNYDENGWVYLAFSDPASFGKAMTKIVRGRINNGSWVDQDVLFVAQSKHYVKSRVHFGSRITFDSEGYLYFSIGDRGQKDQAQYLTRPNGKIHRINRDGTIPNDNPFVERGEAYPSIYAFGNRNPQGLIIHPETGVLWETEHGPKGGDELNAITPGTNYGWPRISYGRNYSGTVLTPHTALPGMAQPASHWTPSIAVCGLDVYSGDLFPEWRGRLLVGSLRNQSIRLVQVEGDQYISEDILIQNQGRIRDVTTGPDGAIYVALPDRIARVSPRQ